MSDLQVKTRRNADDVAGVLTASGEIRTEIASHLYGAAHRLLDEGACHLLIDLSGVVFMDSASLAVMIRLDRELRKADGKLVLYAPSKAVARVLEHSGLDDRFLIAEDEAGARALLT